MYFMRISLCLALVLLCYSIPAQSRETPRIAPFVESHKLSDGSIVDCVKLEDQLTLRHPQFKDHVIPKPPQSLQNIKSPLKIDGDLLRVQLFHHEVEGGCPKGTIPIQKSRNQGLRRKQNHIQNEDSVTEDAQFKIDFAIAKLEGEFTGALSRISIWKPDVAAQDESTSQIWVLARNQTNVNAVEVGWHVFPALYEDNESHLFVYWTADNFKNTGCFNLDCPGFIQIDPNFVLGGAYDKSMNGRSQLFVIGMRDTNGDVWLKIEDYYVGYWPRSLFTEGLLKDQFPNLLQWGGATAKALHILPPSKVPMGNGKFGSSAQGPVRDEVDVPAHQAVLSYLTTALEPREADKITISETLPQYYNTKTFSHMPAEPGQAGGTWLFFGGPGE